MDETVRMAVERNTTRILADPRGRAYIGHEDDLREGLRLMAGQDWTAAGVFRVLDGCDPAAPGMALMLL